MRSLWSPDGIDIAQVVATWPNGVIVKWIERRRTRSIVYTPLARFHSTFSRHVEPFNPDTCRERSRGLD